ncbi:MAG: exodeoxyribonuclease VII small subunit [Gammaproteobacteria bacterium]|nr:exodeoxyribonuclease VII small subunit [Gammaproteobacteria bacterium]
MNNEIQTIDIEKNLERLETIIKDMESKQLKLEKSLALFEEGLNLIKLCQQSLTHAELKVKELTEKTAT